MSPSAEPLVPASPQGMTKLRTDHDRPANALKKSVNGNSHVVNYLSIEPPRPYDVLTSALPLPTPASDTGYWWRETGLLMSNLLAKANYPLYTHYKYLLLYHSHVLPLLGPAPLQDKSTQAVSSSAPWPSFLTDDFSPLEPSWNINGSSDAQSTIRLGIEPIGWETGTATDPFNQVAVTQFMQSYSAAEIGASRLLFEHFRDDFFVRQDEHAGIRAKTQHGEHTTQSFLAFDLNANRITTKAYFFPILRGLISGQDTTKVISDSILRLARKSPVWGAPAISALSVVEAWIASCGGAAKAEMISVDCLSESDSRIKIYVRVPYTSLQKVKDAYCLGGRLTDQDTTDALKLLDELWRAVFDVVDEHAELPRNDNRTAGTIFNFEIRPGKWLPEPKAYLPVRHYCQSDVQIACRLQAFFGRLGWHNMERDYQKHLEDLL
ncbi:hypothetical protein QQS21_000260 [Conoideocrella luteorostrata]|uniref:Dimethylallyl tryptophan synthase n=1 Tax=Conoideocrella luteorostrata TaxID=1105319 RepID=A0AAJ0G2Q4_9HYPO|nr:hypothetical protein QQS21_000260 [Conoideocrella luteorostrata]